jgi:hypothetical protein
MKTKRKFIPNSWDKEFLLCSPNDLKFLFLKVHQDLLEHYKMRNPDIADAFTITNPIWHIESEIVIRMRLMGMDYTKKEKKSLVKFKLTDPATVELDKKIVEHYTDIINDPK